MLFSGHTMSRPAAPPGPWINLSLTAKKESIGRFALASGIKRKAPSNRRGLSGLQRSEGNTFRWKGEYGFDLNTAHTLDTQLNVFQEFRPQVPAAFSESEFVFLANIDPELQMEVLAQMKARPRLIGLDSMNFWIDGKRPQLDRIVKAVKKVCYVEE